MALASQRSSAPRDQPEHSLHIPDAIFGGVQTPFRRDLERHLTRLLTESSLERAEAFLALVAIATARKFEPLCEFALSEAKRIGISREEIEQAQEMASLMSVMNAYYKFRNVIKACDHLGPPEMQVNPDTRAMSGRKRGELLSLVVSIVNHCEACMMGHEIAARKGGATPEQVHDLARLVAVVRGIETLAFAAKCSGGNKAPHR